MREDVAGPHQREHLLDRRRPEGDVHHQRQLALLGGAAREAERLEAVLADGRRAHPHLDAADEVAVVVGQPPEEVDVEVGEVRALVVLADEADVRDVEERRDPHARAVDDELPQARRASARRPSRRRSTSSRPDADATGSGSMPQ